MDSLTLCNALGLHVFLRKLLCMTSKKRYIIANNFILIHFFYLCLVANNVNSKRISPLLTKDWL